MSGPDLAYGALAAVGAIMTVIGVAEPYPEQALVGCAVVALAALLLRFEPGAEA